VSLSNGSRIEYKSETIIDARRRVGHVGPSASINVLASLIIVLKSIWVGYVGVSRDRGSGNLKADFGVIGLPAYTPMTMVVKMVQGLLVSVR